MSERTFTPLPWTPGLAMLDRSLIAPFDNHDVPIADDPVLRVDAPHDHHPHRREEPAQRVPHPVCREELFLG